MSLLQPRIPFFFSSLSRLYVLESTTDLPMKQIKYALRTVRFVPRHASRRALASRSFEIGRTYILHSLNSEDSRFAYVLRSETVLVQFIAVQYLYTLNLHPCYHRYDLVLSSRYLVRSRGSKWFQSRIHCSSARCLSRQLLSRGACLKRKSMM